MAPKQRQGYGGYGSNAVKAEATPAPEFSAKFAPAVEHFPIKEAAAPPPVAVGTTDSTKPDQASSHTNEELIFSAAFAPAVAHFPIKEAAAPPPVAIGTRDSTKLDRASSDCGMLQIQNEELDAIGLYLNASKTKILTTIALHGISAAPPPVAIGSTDSTKPDRASSDANEQLIASLVRWNKLQAAEARTIQAVEQAAIAAEAIHEAEKWRQKDVAAAQAAAKAAEQRAKFAEAAAAAAWNSIFQASQAAAKAAEQRAKTAEAAAAAAWSSIFQASQAAAQASEQRAKTAEAAAAAAESKIQAWQDAAQAAEQRATSAEAAATAAESKIQAENKQALARLNSERSPVAQLKQHLESTVAGIEELNQKLRNVLWSNLIQKETAEAKSESESESELKRSSISVFLSASHVFESELGALAISLDGAIEPCAMQM